MKKDVYSVKKLNETTFLIDEMGRDICYLLLGEEKALLIDCTIGTGDLKAVVEEITSLPVILAATHAHTDHLGGAWQFKEAWVHEDDNIFLFRITNSRLYRNKQLSNRMKKSGISSKDLKGRIWNCKWKSFQSEKVFDLGGRKVTAILTPGHSPGSCVFIDDKEKMMFTGDNTCPFLLMKMAKATTLEKWLEGAEKTLALSEEYAPWCAHGDGTQSKEQIAHTIELVKEIMKMHPQNEKKSKKAVHPKNSKGNCVVYDTAKIYE